MRKVSLDRARAGYRVARTILSLDGVVLLSAGTVLTDEMIATLESYNFTEIYIEDDLSRDIKNPEVVREEIVTEVKAKIKNIMTSPSIRISVDGKKILEIVDKLLGNILQSDQIVLNISDIRSIDDYTFSHSVNVCILSLIIGIAMGVKGDNLKDLGTGALLHDVGKVMVSEDILLKPSCLSKNEFEEAKRHTAYGYEILRNSSSINTAVQEIALYHHERLDGSGYPYGLKNSEIPLYARIVAVADVYDALTTDRVYRKKMLPHEVVDYMYSLSNKHFDRSVLDAFTKHVAHFPIGTAVLLNTGEKGLVSRYNPQFPNRPVIRIVMDEAGKMLVNHKEVDLSKRLEYRIIDIWDI